MKVLGISPLDKDATVSLVEDGRVLFAAAEERFSRQKQHAGFPEQALRAALETTRTSTESIAAVVYAFYTWDRETSLMREGMVAERESARMFPSRNLEKLLVEAERRVRHRDQPIHGLRDPNQTMQKSVAKRLFYRLAGSSRISARVAAAHASRRWLRCGSRDHRHWQQELERGLSKYGLLPKLRRVEHHHAHAANAYLSSGYDRALIVTFDGYGSGLAGSVSLGEGGSIRRLHNIRFPHSLGSYYESVTASLGFRPDRHAGKIVGLAAYGDPLVLEQVLLGRFKQRAGDYHILDNLNPFFSRHLASRFPMVDVAAAYQHVLEVVACKLVRYWVEKTGCDSVVFSGGVTANVKMNQRMYEVEGVERTFIYPNMGDGGCATGGALLLSHSGGVDAPISEVYYGPSYTDGDIRTELVRAGLQYNEPGDLAGEIARQLHDGRVIARFDGRMEYGPRALGNRSILYHAREPSVNQWLNQRLGRTEFMPFAPVTLYEERHRCFYNVTGAEHAAQFMTITFDCTEWMKVHCPAAVHIDGTARPQLIKREVNAGYYDIVKAYERLSGIPCLINTSFNMHEEPIVLTPRDAVRGFLEAHLDALAIGPYLVPHPRARSRSDSANMIQETAAAF